MKPKKYYTVTCQNTEELDLEVSKLLKEGWELYGSPYSTSEGSSVDDGRFEIIGYSYQAMVKLGDYD